MDWPSHNSSRTKIFQASSIQNPLVRVVAPDFLLLGFPNLCCYLCSCHNAEGGSKAVCLIDAVDLGAGAKNFVMRKSVKAFTDTILDLIVDTEETRDRIVDYYGKKEIL